MYIYIMYIRSASRPPQSAGAPRDTSRMSRMHSVAGAYTAAST